MPELSESSSLLLCHGRLWRSLWERARDGAGGRAKIRALVRADGPAETGSSGGVADEEGSRGGGEESLAEPVLSEAAVIHEGMDGEGWAIGEAGEVGGGRADAEM